MRILYTICTGSDFTHNVIRYDGNWNDFKTKILLDSNSKTQPTWVNGSITGFQSVLESANWWTLSCEDNVHILIHVACGQRPPTYLMFYRVED